MDKATLRMMNDAERELLRRVDPKKLKSLGEDELIDLHTRVRRARTKYSKLHRRRASAQVASDRNRSRATKAHARTAVKAEVFEDALADVSRALAAVARDAAEELRAERLERARAAKAGSRTTAKGSAKGKGSTRSTGSAKAKKQQRTPISKRTSASSRAGTRRAQAKKAKR
ncbi:MAG: hypothetical protein MUE36_14540 [Acidimicrobiales bacterium]|jgi:hypothetical protein|nr:hypothetical protein [Acidimicrobiales bacterium]